MVPEQFYHQSGLKPTASYGGELCFLTTFMDLLDYRYLLSTMIAIQIDPDTEKSENVTLQVISSKQQTLNYYVLNK